MLSKLKTIALGALLVGLAASPAFAAGNAVTPAPYVFGQATRLDAAKGNRNDGTAATVGGGFRFNEYFAVEGAYSRLNKSESIGRNDLTARAVGILPVNEQLDLFAKAGVTRIGHSLSGDNDQRKTAATYGIGAKFNIDKNWAVRVDYDRKKLAQSINADTYSAGVQFSF